MRAFATKRFHVWASKEGLTEAVLAEAVEEIIDGLIGAEELLGYTDHKLKESIKSGSLKELQMKVKKND